MNLYYALEHVIEFINEFWTGLEIGRLGFERGLCNYFFGKIMVHFIQYLKFGFKKYSEDFYLS